MNKKYIVRLSDEECGVCQEVVKRLKGTSEKVKRAQILLKADVDGPGWSDAKIAEAFDCRVQTVETLRKRLVVDGFEAALERKRRATPPTPRKLDGVGEAKLIAMRLGKPPAALWPVVVATAGRRSRTKADWALEVAQLLDTRYADCAKVTLVCDNLNTHTKGAFYEAFTPEVARAYVKRIDFCHTPKHGSWLNIAECELSCLTSQCLSDRRIGELARLPSEIGIWADKTNAKQRGVDWQFKITDARIKLKRLYPVIKGG